MSYYKRKNSYNLAQNQNNMASAIDAYLAANQTQISEEAIGKQFANRIKANLLSSIRSKTGREGSGLSLRSDTRAFYKFGLLDKITIYTPYYIYPILNNGFEGSKARGYNFRVKERDFFTETLENGKIMNDLADLIGGSRASKIVNRINIKLFDDKTVEKVLADE